MNKKRSPILITLVFIFTAILFCFSSAHSYQLLNMSWIDSADLYSDYLYDLSARWLCPTCFLPSTYLYPGISHENFFTSYLNLWNYQNLGRSDWNYFGNWQQSNSYFYQSYPFYYALDYTSYYSSSWLYPFGFKKKKSSGTKKPYSPAIDPADFVEVIDNPYWPLTPGTIYAYLGEREDSHETIIVEVLDDTRQVMDVTCTVVRDRVYLNGELTEDTYDWYAQDNEGNVWYFGEDSIEYEVCEEEDNELDEEGEEEDENEEDEDECTSTAGSWEAGVDGALPGILMKAQPQVGESYRQEYYEGEAEDMAVVVNLNATIVLDDGTTYENCLQTLEWTPLSPDALEYKYYASGIGLVMEEMIDGAEKAELQGIDIPFLS